MCANGVVSLIVVILKPLDCSALRAVSLPEPGPLISTINIFIPYSKALAAYGKEWSFEEMNGFLIKPSAHIKGTKMAFAGLKKEKDRASVILYMNSKSDKPLPTP